MGVAEDTPFPADQCRPGQSVADVIAERTRAFAAGRGVDLSWASTDQMMRLHQYNVFPNMTLLVNADHLTVMTAHPGPDPDHGELVMILWTRMPPGAPRTKPADVRMKADEAHPGLVLTQDITVLAGLQRGLHQPGLTHLTLSNEERRVINMHRNLDRYLDLPESDRITGGETPDGPAAQTVGNPKGTTESRQRRGGPRHRGAADRARRSGRLHDARPRRAARGRGHVDLLARRRSRQTVRQPGRPVAQRRWRICPSRATTPVDRIASLARSQRTVLIERQHLLAIAHERDRTPLLFLPIQQTLAAQLAELGVTGTDAALVLRAVQVHVISSAVMQFSAVRGAKHDEEDPSLWTDDWPDQSLVEALQSPTDYDAVFEYGLNALLAPLRDRGGDG